VYRQDRLNVIENYPILSGGRECYALIKKFEIRKFNKEFLFFRDPVEVSNLADYSIHVRHPMCFHTLKEKLDNSFADTGGRSSMSRGGNNVYSTYGQFLKDLRLIFKNAKTYNAVHMEADETSRIIYEAAVMFTDLMTEWISKDFSVEVAEKVGLHIIKTEEQELAAAKLAEEERRIKEADDAYRQSQIEILMKADPVFAADQLSRQASAAALARNMSTKSSSGGVGLISLPGGDLASVEELSGEAATASTKRKRVIDYDESESEGELYEEEGEASDDGDDEDYKEEGGKKKARKKKSSSKRRRVEEETEEEDTEPGAMDIFAQHDATQALLKQKEEILQIRQQGSVAAAGGMGTNSGSVAASAATVEMQLREDGRQRTRDAVWAAFGQPRMRRGRRRRGESFAEDESDSMSECSDITSVSSSTVASSMSKNVAASTTTDTAASAQPMTDRTCTNSNEIAQAETIIPPDHRKTTNFNPNITFFNKMVSRPQHSQQKKASSSGNLQKKIEKTDFFGKYFLSPDEVEQEKETAVAYDKDKSNSTTSIRDGRWESDNVTETAMEVDVPHVSIVKQKPISILTAVAKAVSSNQKHTGKKAISNHRITISRIMRPQSTLTSTSSSVYDILCADEKENLDEESDLFISEKILQMSYLMESGSSLVQLLVPWSLLCRSSPYDETDQDQVPESNEHQNVPVAEGHPSQSLVVSGSGYHLPSLTSTSNMTPGLTSIGSGIAMNLNPTVPSAPGHLQPSPNATINPPLLMSSSSMTLLSGLADPLQGGAPQGGDPMLSAYPNGQNQAQSHHLGQVLSQQLPQQQPQAQQGLLPSVQQAILPLVPQGIQQPLHPVIPPLTQQMNQQPGQQVIHTLPQLTQPPLQQVAQPSVHQHNEGNLRIEIAPLASERNVGDNTMPVFSRARSASGSSPPSRIRRRSRSGSLGCISPSSREREKRLRKNLQHVDEILKYVQDVKHRKEGEAGDAHQLQYAFRQRDEAVRNPVSCMPMNVCAVIKPTTPWCVGGRMKAGGISVGYRNGSIQLLLSSDKSRAAAIRGVKSRHVRHCVSNFTNQSQSAIPSILRDSFISDQPAESCTGESRLEVQTEQVNLHRMTASLPGGVKVSTPMVSATSGVLVSQQAERISMRVSSRQSCVVDGENESEEGAEEEDEELEFIQLWVLTEAEEALSMDLRVNIAW